MDSDVGRDYQSASSQDPRKLELLVNMSLREDTGDTRALQEIAAEVGQKARQRGLTPEILQSILREA